MSQASMELILDELRKFRGEIVDEFQNVRSEIQEVRSDMQSLRDEVKGEIRELRSDMQTLRDEVNAKIEAVRTELLQEIAAIKKEQQAIHKRLNSMEELYAQLIGMIKSLKEQIQEIAARQTEQEQRFSFQHHSQAASIEILHREQLALKTEIELLKTQR